MTSRGVYLSDYLEHVRQAVADSLGCKAELFAGQLTEEDLKKINVPANGVMALVAGNGGPLRIGLRPGEVESHAVCGVFVIAKADKQGNGYSSLASQAVQRLMGTLQRTRLSGEKTPGSIEFLEWGEEVSGFKANGNLSVWGLYWKQLIILKTN